MKVSPHDGCLYYVKVIEGPGVHRICFGGDLPPVALATTDLNYGPSPLTVSLDASESFHPQDYPFEIEWKLPNGETSDQMTLDYTFETNSSDQARLILNW